MHANSAKRVIIESATPREAAALWQLELLSSDELVELAGLWLMQGLDSGSLEVACIAGEVGGIRSDLGPMFARALRELGVPFADDRAGGTNSPNFVFECDS